MSDNTIDGFPEKNKSFPPGLEDVFFIPSSEAVGCGHNEGEHLAPFTNEEFPNTESGEGKGF
jgi:hypothetical protein